eukprot:CAMPEP_0195577448 /NCGR_PEP_ID=MMETSP0814-20130614/10558_1 /TAXON_ID=97485 /ORGANISM="Prymnesium parvum, Strain Texoma1" /LENGTH=65 /DNA_ID=CAMNT_0040713843 /DNA_START=66 /DNA_END=263 /DNA_ORIENTATION=+
MVAGAAWAMTTGSAPIIVRANEHPYEAPHGETEHEFAERMKRQGTSKVTRHVTKEGIFVEKNAGK